MKQNQNVVKKGLTLFVIGIFLTMSAIAQLPTAQSVASQMKVGWNLGNTLESTGGETAWGNPLTTQTLINAVKAAGFNTVRLPVAWDSHANATTHVIDATWIARVKAVVDYCITANMYVIIDIHWDGGWLENNVTTSAQAAVNVKQQSYWTQIANYFKAYDQRVLFASANEPAVSDATGMTVLLSYHQTFINAVRATGGNNSSRTLIIQGPSTDIVTTNNLMNTMPTDQIASRLMVEVHYYTPYQFCLMTADASWGNMFYYWGSGNHSTTDVAHNPTWGEEADVETYFGQMKSKFVDKGYPVIIGEFAAIKRTNLTGAALTIHLASREYFNKYIVSSAVSKGMVPTYWDNGASDMGLFNRGTGAVTDQGVVNAIMAGAGGTTTVAVTGVTMSPTTASIAVGATTQLTATIAPSNATNKTVSWNTSNSAFVTVSSSGLVTGVAAGSATITVTTANGSKTATCAVTVTTSTSTGIVSGGTYEIIARHSGKVIGITGGSTANSATATQQTYSGATYQQFVITDLGSGNYRISPTSITSKALDVNGNSTANNATIIQYTYSGATNQQWQLVASGSYYNIKSRSSGKCIDISGASTADGASIVQYTCGTGTNQQFTFTRLKSVHAIGEDLSEDQQGDIVIYPNPIEKGQILTIEGLQGISTIRIVDMDGKVVKEEHVTNQIASIEANLASGIYAVQAISAERTVVKKLLVK